LYGIKQYLKIFIKLASENAILLPKNFRKKSITRKAHLYILRTMQLIFTCTRRMLVPLLVFGLLVVVVVVEFVHVEEVRVGGEG
jgi:hypothetical protein